ncbi:MAG: helix-turn-helix transcriptional regulator [Methylococcales bacterium]|nr:helix-turn-helix transcriptional regulator [Methylococcales bacterium]
MNDEYQSNLRIKELREHLNLSRDEFCLITGIGGNQLANIENKKQKTPAYIIESIEKIYSNYGYWLATGKTLPECEQTSPELEETRNKQNLLTGTN